MEKTKYSNNVNKSMKKVTIVILMMFLMVNVSAMYNNLYGDVNIEDNLFTGGDLNFQGNTNERMRFTVDPSTNMTEIERYANDMWQAGSLMVGVNSLWLGRTTALAALGHHVATESIDGHLHLLVHDEFDGNVTTDDAKVLYAYDFNEYVIFQPDNSSTWTGTNLNFSFPSTAHSLAKKIYYQTGSTAATSPILIQIWKGLNDSGTLVFQQRYHASNFPADSDIFITTNGYIEYDTGQSYFLKYTSDAPFSLKSDSTQTYPWFAVDISSLRQDNLLQTESWVNGTNFTDGQYLIRNRTIYVATQTGVQTGTFESNLDKWDKLTHSADTNYWTKTGNDLSYSLGNAIVTNGNIIAKGTGTGAYNFVAGEGSGYYLTSGYNNVLIGEPAGAGLTEGLNNILIGRNAGSNLVDEDENVLIGYNAGFSAPGLANSVGVGAFTLWDADNAIRTTAIGYMAGRKSNVTDGVYIGYDAGAYETESSKLWIGNVNGDLIEGSFADGWLEVLGELRVYGNNGITSNFIAGLNAGDSITSGGDNTFVGESSGNDITVGSDNTFYGSNSGNFVGGGTESYNTLIGSDAGLSALGIMSSTGIGYESLKDGVDAWGTTAVGYRAGKNATGRDGVYLGLNAGMDESTNSKLWISNVNNDLIEGSFADKWVTVHGDLLTNDSITIGYNQTISDYKLSVIGEYPQIFISNSPIAWIEMGVTDLGVLQYITDGVDFFTGGGAHFSVNDFLYYNSSLQRVGIGTTTPSDELNVVGDTNITGELIVGEYLRTQYRGGFGEYENIISSSNDMSNGWELYDSNISSTTQTAPDGTATASRVNINTAAGPELLRHNSFNEIGTHTISFWAKLISGFGDLHLLVGGEEWDITVTSEWQKFTHTGTAFTDDVEIQVTESRTIDFWGWQSVEGSEELPHVTTGTSVIENTYGAWVNGDMSVSGNAIIGENITVGSINVLNPNSITLDGVHFTRFNTSFGPTFFTGVLIDDNWGIRMNKTGSATSSVINYDPSENSNAITSTSNNERNSVSIFKFSSNHNIPNLGAIYGNAGRLKIFGQKDSNDSLSGIDFGFVDGTTISSEYQTTGFANETTVMSLLNDSVNIYTDLFLPNGTLHAYGPGGAISNFVAGLMAGDSLTTGFGNVLIGYEAGNVLTNEDMDTFVGFKAGLGASGLDNAIGIGHYALENADGASRTIALGREAGKNANGVDGLYLGYEAGEDEDEDDKLHISNTLGDLMEGDFANSWLKVWGDLEVTNDLYIDGDLDFTGGEYHTIHEINSSTDALNVSKRRVIDLDTSSYDITIGGMVGGFHGQRITLMKPDGANILTIENMEGFNQEIATADGNDIIRNSGNSGGWDFIFMYGEWIEIA